MRFDRSPRELSAEAHAVVSSAAAALSDPQAEVRTAALARLKELYITCEGGTCTTDAEVARATLPSATRALADPNPEIRVSGARAIELLAADAGGALASLARALVDEVPAVRLAALEALCEAGEGAASVAAEIAERLTEGTTPDERSVAATALGNAGAQAEHVDALVAALVHDCPAVQASAAHALALALEDAQEDRRERVSRALRRLSLKTE